MICLAAPPSDDCDAKAAAKMHAANSKPIRPRSAEPPRNGSRPGTTIEISSDSVAFPSGVEFIGEAPLTVQCHLIALSAKHMVQESLSVTSLGGGSDSPVAATEICKAVVQRGMRCSFTG